MTTTTTQPSSTGATNVGGLTVLIADKFEASGVDAARAMGCRVEIEPDLSADALPEAVGRLDPDVLIVRSTKVPAPVFDAARKLSLIIRAGAGYDNIDVAAASAHGVFVANCPGKNGIAVAEIAWGLILACDRRIPDQTIALREGTWNKKGFSKARGLYGRTLGVIGLGTIGTEVVKRGKAFGMKVVAWSRSLTPETAEELGVRYAADPLEVARSADVISLHIASTPETKHFVNATFLDAMKDGAFLINTARGAVVDEAALAKAIESRGLRAGFDVWEQQPTPTDTTFEDALIRCDGVYGTHHCGASTDQAQDAIATETVRILDVYAKTGVAPNCVNRAAASPARYLLTVRHHNRAGVLSHVFRVLSEANINVEEMENIIYEGAKAACARIRLDDEPTEAQLAAIRANDAMLSVDLGSV